MDSYMFKLKFINKMCWKQNHKIKFSKPNEGLRYEKYILFIHVLTIKVFSFTNHMFEFNFSKVWL
jgi:hypothetical protein